jgi:small-conductance mechanosensitive channel
MNMHHLSTLKITLLVWSTMLSVAHSQETLVSYTQTSEALLEHLGESIPVLELSNGTAKTEQEKLTNRLESLQNKRVSNREWYEFWQDQAAFSQTLITNLESLTPEQLELQKRVLNETLKKLLAQTQTPTLIVQQRIATLRSEIKSLVDKNTQLDARLDSIRLTLNKLGKTAAGLSPTPTTAKRTDKGDALEIAIRDTEAQIERLTKAYQDNEASLLTKEGRLETLTVDPTSLTDLEVKNDTELKQALATIKKLANDQTEGASAQRAVESTRASLRELKLLQGASLREKLFLVKWLTLSKDKMTSQDGYLKAIDEELAAVEERLRTFESKVKDGQVSGSEDNPCQPSITNKLTPFFNHRACVAKLKNEIQERARALQQTALEQTLYVRFSKTNAQLVSAQTIDVQLVRREHKLSDQAIALNPRKTEWTSVWTDYAQRGKQKVKNLELALQQSRKSKRIIKAKMAVFAVAVERQQAQLNELRAHLKNKSSIGDTLKAIAFTGLSIIQVGWPALVYLLIAFTLIRLVRSMRDKKERESEEMNKGQTHEKLQVLERELQVAQEAKNDELVMSLHEDIGIIESQLKDQGQRVATIARVAAQAVTLVIYIATALLVLDALTVDIGPILGGAAIFGLAISFGSQSLVKDVVSGFFILLENQYAVGDVVNINGQSGSVEKVTLRRTVLRNSKGEVHNLTNGSISSVTNMTQGWARVVMHLGVAYGTDIDLVKSVVNEVGERMYAEDEWRAKLTEKPTFVGVTAFGESEITIRAWCKTKTFQNWSVERELNIRLKTAFEKAKIEIPFPKRDINLVISKPDLLKTLGD